MINIEDVVGSLEDKIGEILHKLERLEQANLKLNNELLSLKQELLNKNEQFVILEEKHEALKMTNAILGSDENKRETKLKINALIREIDHCIVQLSD